MTGPGGAGKTRLAVEAAAALRAEHRDGAWLVELAGVAQAGEVAPAAAIALEASAFAGPQPAGSTTQLIVRHLAGRSLVVVLDNCEHVIGEAAALADTLLGAVPGLRLIATSREPLGISGEILVPVSGLAPPAAVELFVDRARAVRPGFSAAGQAGVVVEDICRRLDGLPLAVELAAARLRALPLATVAERLGDRFRLLTGGARTVLPRQQTLRAVVDWSYDLLFEDERRLFARLATFTGGCGLTAAEAVCADEYLQAGEILDVLSRLVDKSLVTASSTGSEARFSQLQTLWQYGLERLGESGEADATRARHGAHYLQMADDAHEGLRGATGTMWRDRLTAELGNLRAALDWYIATDDADAAVSLASGMAWLWYINGDFAEGARWLGDALGIQGPCRHELEATAHVWHGFLVCMSSSPAAGIVECEAAVTALRSSGNRVRAAEALVVCAAVLVRAHEFGRSLDALDEARDLLEPSGQLWLLAGHDMVLAWSLLALGRLDDAESAARSSVEGFDALGEVWLVFSPLSTLAGIAEARGDRDGASAAYESLVERCRSAGQRIYVPESLGRLAALRAGQGDDAAADRLYADAIACSFNPWLSADAMVGQAAVARRLGDLPRARALLDAAGGHYRQVDLPSGQPRVLAGLAWCALAAGQPSGRRRLRRRRRPRRLRQRRPGRAAPRRYGRGRGQGGRRSDRSQHRRLRRPRPAARPGAGVSLAYRRTRCDRPRRPPREPHRLGVIHRLPPGTAFRPPGSVAISAVIGLGLKPFTTSHTPSESSQAATGTAASSAEPSFMAPNSVAMTVQMRNGAPMSPITGMMRGTSRDRYIKEPSSSALMPGMKLWLSRNVQW